MKSRNMVMRKITIQPSVAAEEEGKSAPTPVETRLRVFEIHTDSDGIHRLTPDTWPEADGNRKNISMTRKEKQTGNEVRHQDDVDIRGGNSVTSSLVAWYHILRTQHHWTIFQAIRYALWLAR
jgi:hypothetical protein